MKLKSILSAFAAVALFAVGCTEEPMATELAELQVSDTYVALPAEGGNAAITVTANTDWAFDGVPEWLTITPASGAAGETSISFSAAAVTSAKEAVIKILVGGTEQYIHVQQGVKEAAKPSTCAEILAGPDNKTYQVTGTCVQIANTQYGNWYIKDASTDKTVYIYGTLNNGEEKKFDSLNPSIEVGDVITVEGPKTTYNGTVELVNVNVLKVVKSLLAVPEKEFSAQSSGGNVEVKLVYKGNDLQVKPAVDWISMADINVNADTTIVTLKIDENTAKPRVGTVHFASSANGQASEADITVSQAGLAGTLETPFTVSEAIEFCSKLTGPTSENFYVKGIVSKIPSQYSAKYGNGQFWLSEDGVYNDDKAKDFEGYNVYWFDNKQWVEGNGVLSVGDEVLVCGQLTNYNGTCETNGKKAWIVSINGFTSDTKGMNLASALSIKDACALCANLTANTPNMYYVQGIVSELTKYQFGASYNTASFWLTDDGTTAAADKFEAYSIYYMNNKDLKSDVKWPENGKLIEVGQKIVLRGYLTNYSGTCETAGKKAYIVSINGKTE